MSPDTGCTANIRRILVAVDGSGHSLAALEAATTLAARLQAELEALFVEDVGLLQLAELPCARVVSLTLQQAEPTDRERIERQLRLQAGRARDSLQRWAAALGVRARFRAVRGQVTAEVLAAAEEADLLSLGRSGHCRLYRQEAGSTFRAALSSGRPVLVAGSRPAAGDGLLVVCDGSAESERALRLAAGLVADSGGRLHALMLNCFDLEGRAPAAAVRAQLDALDVTPILHHSWADPATAVAAALRRLQPALLIVSGDLGVRMVEQVDCPLLLVP